MKEDSIATKYGEYSMYSCNGGEAPARCANGKSCTALGTWSLIDGRAVTLDTSEKVALHMMYWGLNPDQILIESKFSPSTTKTHGCKAMERVV